MGARFFIHDGEAWKAAAAKAPSWTEAGERSEVTPPTQSNSSVTTVPPGPGLVRGQEETTTEQSCQEGVAVPADDYPDKSHRYCVATVIVSSL